MEGGVNLGIRFVNQRVSGNGEHAHLLVGHIISHQHDGVGVAAALVGADQHEGVGLFLSDMAALGHAGGSVLLCRLVCLRRCHARGRHCNFINTISNDNHRAMATTAT